MRKDKNRAKGSRLDVTARETNQDLAHALGITVSPRTRHRDEPGANYGALDPSPVLNLDKRQDKQALCASFSPQLM